jgi:hypothetical protein
MTGMIRCIAIALVFGILVSYSEQSLALDPDEPKEQSIEEAGEEESSTGLTELAIDDDEIEFMSPGLDEICFAERPDTVCIGSHLNSPQSWTSGKGCLADIKEACDTIVVMDISAFPSNIKFTILLPAVTDPSSDVTQNAEQYYRLFLSVHQFGQSYMTASEEIDGEKTNETQDDASLLLEEEVQFFQIFKNSSTIAVSRSLVDAEPEAAHRNEYGDLVITGGGFVFPHPDEDGNGEEVRDPATGRIFERYSVYSGSKILIGKLRKLADNRTAPMFLDLEQDDFVLHLEKLVLQVTGNHKQEDNDPKLVSLIQSPAVKLPVRQSESQDDASTLPRPVITSYSNSMLSISYIDLAMVLIIIALIFILMITCPGSLKLDDYRPGDWIRKCLQIRPCPMRGQRNHTLMSEVA